MSGGLQHWYDAGIRWLTAGSHDAGADEQSFIAGVLEKEKRRLTRHLLYAIIPYSFASLIPLTLVWEGSFRTGGIAGTVFTILAALILLRMERRGIPYVPELSYIGCLVHSSVTPWIMKFGGLAVVSEPAVAAILIASYMFVLGIQVLLCPWFNRRLPVSVLVLLVAGVTTAITRPEGAYLLLVLTSVFSVFCYLKLIIVRGLFDEARHRWRENQLQRSVERAKIAHDMILARQIQDSLAPAPRMDFGGGMVLCSFSSKHSGVGGDWMAVREVRDGGVVLLVADATGKGMQASLVIHALQSLWADTLDDEDFDPAAWLLRVNNTLVRLGERKPHTATVGILMVAGGRATYHSAGHLPCFVVADGRRVQALSAQGSMLGLSRNFRLKSAETILDNDSSWDLLLGTDGVFDRGSRMQSGAILQSLATLRAGGPDALRLVSQADDDKTVFWLGRSRQAGQESA